MFLPHFDVFFDLLLNRHTATWNLFVLYNKELNFIRIKADGDVNRRQSGQNVVSTTNFDHCDDEYLCREEYRKL